MIIFPFKTLDMIEIKTESMFQTCLQKQYVLVDFYGNWCGPCRTLTPVLEKLSKLQKYSNVVFVKVDVDKLDSICEKYRVTAMPTLILLQNGREVGRVVGADQTKIEALLQKYVTH